MFLVDKDIEKVYDIQTKLNYLKVKYSFIKSVSFIADSGTIGLNIYNPRMVHMLYGSFLKEHLRGFRWEGEYPEFLNDLERIDILMNKYENIEFMFPYKPKYVFVKYAGKQFGVIKNLYSYIHEIHNLKELTLIERLKYYALKIYYFCVCWNPRYYEMY